MEEHVAVMNSGLAIGDEMRVDAASAGRNILGPVVGRQRLRRQVLGLDHDEAAEA